MLKEIYYFGSFNPFHNGHRRIAEVVSEYFDNCKIHIAPTPCSPMKKVKDMLSIDDRFAIIEATIEDSHMRKFLDVSDIDVIVGENKKHYTCETLEVIKEQYNGYSKDIGILIGADELAIFDQWKNWQWIMDNFTVVVYPRVGFDVFDLLKKYPKAILGAEVSVEHPCVLFEYSSTQIRVLLENFDENRKYLSVAYNGKAMKIFENIYNKRKNDNQ